MSNQFEVPLDRIANVPVTEGVHLFTVSRGEESVSKNNNPMWTFYLACNTPGEEGKEVPLFLVLTPSARWKLELFLDAMNAPKTGSVTIDKFIGRKMRAQIVHEKYEGKDQARIGEMYPVSAAPKSSQAPVAKNPAVKNVSASTQEETTSAKKPVTAIPADAVGSDDIPF